MLFSSLNPPEFWPFFPIVFVGMWITVGFILSRLGWRSFANRYPVQTRPTGTTYASPSTKFGYFGPYYRNVVRVILTNEGINFYALFLFRAFHPPFLVPWKSVARVEKTRRFFRPHYRIYIIDSAGEIEVLLPQKIETDLLRFRNEPIH